MATFNDNFLKACRKEVVTHTPVWFMRQAGRYQPEYRAIRKTCTMLEACRTPELAAQITLLPVAQLNVDAAILFSDIMIPLTPMGLDLDIKENVGPVISNPVRSAADIDALKGIIPSESLEFVGKSIQMLRKELNVPLIGFCGAPFTLASYILEGRPSKNFVHTKSLMYADNQLWDKLMQKLTDAMIAYLQYQVASGAQALQVFDSWVGNLDREDYKRYVLPYMKQLFTELQTLNVPLIHFGVGTAHLLDLMVDAGCTVIGVDWKTPINEARKIIGNRVALQGNLDSTVVFGDKKIIQQKVNSILESAYTGSKTGFIFNLGHGVIPETDPVVLKAIVEQVHAWKQI